MTGGLNDWERNVVDAAADRVAALDPGSATIAVIPYQRRPVLPTVPRLRKGFEAHLDRLIETAFASDPGTDDPGRDERPHHPRLDAACMLCHGHCCLSGGDHAHLGAEDIRRYRRRHPDAGPGDIRARYLENLPEETVLLSCVYHGAGGCGLPRHLRSTTCNHLICRGQRVIAEGAAAGDRAAILVAAPRDRAVALARWTPEQGFEPE